MRKIECQDITTTHSTLLNRPTHTPCHSERSEEPAFCSSFHHSQPAFPSYLPPSPTTTYPSLQATLGAPPISLSLCEPSVNGGNPNWQKPARAWRTPFSSSP